MFLRRFAAGLALLFLFPVGPASAAEAADPPSFTVSVWDTDTENELPENTVIALTQTRDGYLWLGTLNGLVRFDGIRFTVFNQGNTPGLNSSRIVRIFEDSAANLWIGTETAGAVLVKNGVATSLDLGRGSSEGRLVAMCEDTTGAVWLYTADGELARYQQGRLEVWRVEADYSSNYRTIAVDKSGLLWIATDWRMLAFRPGAIREHAPLPPPEIEVVMRPGPLNYLLASRSGGYWRLAEGRIQKWEGNRLQRDLGAYPWNPRHQVSAACEDQHGNLLVGTLGSGLFWFNQQGEFTQISTDQQLSKEFVLSLHVDREDTLWVGTDGGGLNRVKHQVFSPVPETLGLVVQTVSADRQGGFWIGYNGGGLDHWRAGTWQRLRPSDGFISLPIRSVFVDSKARTWVGTLGGGLFQLQIGQIQPLDVTAVGRFVLAIHEDRGGRLWVGTQGRLGTTGGLARWDERTWTSFGSNDGLSSDVVRAIADDAAGNLWIGTRGGGLNRFKDGQFTALHKTDGLPSEDISSLYVDRDDVLWIGTDGNGLARLENGKWTSYTTRDGLLSDSVGYLVEDDLGYLWIGSYKGLMRVRRQALNDFAHGVTNSFPVRVYKKQDGLPTSECTLGSQPAAARTPDGRLWFPTIEGLASVDPARLDPNANSPSVVIESVTVDGLSQHTNTLRNYWPETITLPARNERLEIQYTSLNLGAPERARFRFMLEGHEKAWTDAGNTRVARYVKLPPGHYRFRVTACNEDGVWNQTGRSLAFVIKPPYWRTWWFLTGSIVVILGTVTAIVHYLSTQRLHRQLERLRQQEALERERSRIARDIHDQLGASLTQVALLGELVESDKESPADVTAHAQQISQTARETTRTLDEIVWTVNPSNDTLDGLITYVTKHAQEYLAVAGIRYRQDIPDQLPNTQLPPEVRHNVFLAAKESVTNVVRHARATAVCLRLRLDPGSFTLEIEDDGRGLADLDPQTTRNGLRNMRKRMEDIGGTASLTPAAERGTLVRLKVPFTPAPNAHHRSNR